MKKLTNKSDTKDALEAFGLEVMGDEHITSKGNLKGVVRNENELTSNIDKVYEYWQQRGFPYYSTDEQYREEQKQKVTEEIEQFMTESRNELAREKQKLYVEIKEYFSQLVVLATEKILHRTIKSEDHNKLIDEVLQNTDMNKEN